MKRNPSLDPMEALPGPFGPILDPKIQKMTKIQKCKKLTKSGPLLYVAFDSADLLVFEGLVLSRCAKVIVSAESTLASDKHYNRNYQKLPT